MKNKLVIVAVTFNKNKLFDILWKISCHKSGAPAFFHNDKGSNDKSYGIIRMNEWMGYKMGQKLYQGLLVQRLLPGARYPQFDSSYFNAYKEF